MLWCLFSHANLGYIHVLMASLLFIRPFQTSTPPPLESYFHRRWIGLEISHSVDSHLRSQPHLAQDFSWSFPGILLTRSCPTRGCRPHREEINGKILLAAFCLTSCVAENYYIWPFIYGENDPVYVNPWSQYLVWPGPAAWRDFSPFLCTKKASVLGCWWVFIYEMLALGPKFLFGYG